MALPGKLFFNVFFVIFNRLLLEILVGPRETLTLNSLLWMCVLSVHSYANQLHFDGGPLCSIMHADSI